MTSRRNACLPALITCLTTGAIASGQTATVLITAEDISGGGVEAWRLSVTANGDLGIFGYNLLVDAIAGAEFIDRVENLQANPTGSSAIFGAPAGAGLGAGSGFGVDHRDASAGVLISPIPIDNVPFFSFDVIIDPSVQFYSVTYGSAVGSGTLTGALTYPDSSVPPVIRGLDYPSIDFGSVTFARVPAPTTAAPLAVFGIAAARRRRRLGG